MKYFLENDTLGLRDLRECDATSDYLNWFNDADVCRYNSHHRFPVTEQELISYIISVRQDHTKIVFAVIEKESMKHIGNISLQQIDLMNRQAEIAFMFGNKDYWSMGYATSAAKLIIDHAFMELGMNRIYFGTNEQNVGMQRVGEHLNFKYGGVSRQALYKNGKYVDIRHYDLLREEWEGSTE